MGRAVVIENGGFFCSHMQLWITLKPKPKIGKNKRKPHCSKKILGLSPLIFAKVSENTDSRIQDCFRFANMGRVLPNPCTAFSQFL